MSRAIRIGLCCVGVWSCGASSAGDTPSARIQQALAPQAAPVGLSLLFSNGAAPPLRLLGEGKRFVQELDLVEAVPSTTDDGIQPLLQGGRASGLDWNGIEQVEEVWVPSLDGTFTRERYFRGAGWMNQPSTFVLAALDGDGEAVGAPWVVHAAGDDLTPPTGDAFVRRFVARQSAFGCPSPGDCTGATYLAEALVQLRGALSPESGDRCVPASATALRLTWNQIPAQPYVVEVEHSSASESEFDHGFQVELEPASVPANGLFYMPGETLSFRVTFRDGRGNRLHPAGQLPSYGSFVTGQVNSGLRYLDLSLQTRLYYALKHRESNVLFVLSGPTDELRTPQTVVDPNLFFGPQVPFATRAMDGYTAIGQTVPPAGIIFGGLLDPALWSLPVSDVITFTLPADAEPGTYVAAIKARRDFAGEALNRGATLDIQVGQSQPTDFLPRTECGSCHTEQDRTGFGSVLHGIDDRRACFGCHSSLGIEFDNALDIRVHAIHDRSNRFDADIQDCSVCHVTPPQGPQRGVLP